MAEKKTYKSFEEAFKEMRSQMINDAINNTPPDDNGLKVVYGIPAEPKKKKNKQTKQDTLTSQKEKHKTVDIPGRKLVYFMEKGANRCHFCGAKMEWVTVKVEDRYRKNAKIHMYYCKRCHCYQLYYSNEMFNILTRERNHFIVNVSQIPEKDKIRKMVEDRTCVNNTAQEKKKSQTTNFSNDIYVSQDSSISSKMLASIALLGINSNLYIGQVHISYQKSVKDNSAGVYGYCQEFGREVLAAILRSEKKGKIHYNGKEFYIKVQRLDPNVKREIMTSVEIRKNGGFASLGNGDKSEVVDVLMYSPYTKRYEITKASYDSQNKRYYMDMARLKSFIYEYGNPDITLMTYSKTKQGNSFEQLKDESLLHEFGYNVNKQDDLSDWARQKLLSDIVDLKWMSVRDIVNLLTWNIQMHSNDMYEDARIKWAKDRKFIQDYKLNTQRFIIRS